MLHMLQIIDFLLQYCGLQLTKKALTAGVGILEQHFPLLDQSQLCLHWRDLPKSSTSSSGNTPAPSRQLWTVKNLAKVFLIYQINMIILTFQSSIRMEYQFPDMNIN